MKSLCKVTLLTSAILFALTGCKEDKVPTAPAEQTIAAPVAQTAVTAEIAPVSVVKQITAASPQIEREAYVVGASFGKEISAMLISQDTGLSNDIILQGINDGFVGRIQLSDDELQEAVKQLQTRMMAEAEKKQQEQVQIDKEAAAKSLVEGEKFRAKFAKEANVHKTASGLLYKIDNPGTGKAVQAGDIVLAHYKGSLTDGKVFDSSYERGEPALIPLDIVISGWKEGMKLIKVGGKINLVIPPQLGYGETSMPGIPSNSTLVFEIELLDVNPEESTEVETGVIIKDVEPVVTYKES